VSRLLIRRQHPPVAGDWLHVPALDATEPELAEIPLPPGIASIATLLRPHATAHRYLLALRGIDEAAALRVLMDQPAHPLPDDDPPPIERWAFALPEPADLQPPGWFAPGPGRRWMHCLVLPGSGALRAGRWAAWDRSARTLYLWDWTDTDPRPSTAALAAIPPAAGG
jgi:hypothetical protein